jgi:hypothetical protein
MLQQRLMCYWLPFRLTDTSQRLQYGYFLTETLKKKTYRSAALNEVLCGS